MHVIDLSNRDTVLDRIALALALMRARLSLPYKLVTALERDILTARRFAIKFYIAERLTLLSVIARSSDDAERCGLWYEEQEP